ncbi:MAG TPA: hypothetical protein VLS49_11080 [Usitatibacter sp.]|nr:hypothetical protein [Usitatibacter sp.]
MPAETFIDDELAAFLESGVSIHAASRDAACVAQLSRGIGCRVDADRRRVTVFLLASQSGAILADFRANGAIAAVFSLPTTHRTVQLKGTDAVLADVEEADLVRIARYREAWVEQLAALGFARPLPRTIVSGARGDIVAVTFTVCAAFVQTPGPSAGTPLKP